MSEAEWEDLLQRVDAELGPADPEYDAWLAEMAERNAGDDWEEDNEEVEGFIQ